MTTSISFIRKYLHVFHNSVPPLGKLDLSLLPLGPVKLDEAPVFVFLLSSKRVTQDPSTRDRKRREGRNEP